MSAPDSTPSQHARWRDARASDAAAFCLNGPRRADLVAG